MLVKGFKLSTKVTNPSGHLRAKDDGTELRIALRGNPGVVLPLRRLPDLVPDNPSQLASNTNIVGTGCGGNQSYDTDSDLAAEPDSYLYSDPPLAAQGQRNKGNKGSGKKGKGGKGGKK